MYTLPLATVGTANFTAFPAWSRLADACELFQSSLARFVASYACKTAGPHQVDCGVQYVCVSMAHTMPLADPKDDTEGVAPGKTNDTPD